MPAKIDIDALKISQNQEQTRQKIKNSQSQDLPVLKRKSVLRLAHLCNMEKVVLLSH